VKLKKFLNDFSQINTFKNIAQKSPQITKNFKFVYILIVLIWILGTYANFSELKFSLDFYSLGVRFGRFALILLGIVVLPGILGRFGLEIPITRVITLFRRQLGITVFLLAFTHYSFVRLLPILSNSYKLKLPPPYFEIAGFWALTFLFLMFITSNNFAIGKMGMWWKRLHRIVYVVLWLLVLHTGLQRISIFSVFIFFFATLEVFSWIIYFFKSKSVNN